jgi:hypothetical protein
MFSPACAFDDHGQVLRNLVPDKQAIEPFPKRDDRYWRKADVTVGPTLGILEPTNNPDELISATSIVGTRSLRGDIRKRHIMWFFKIDELPSYAFTGWPPDLPAAQYMMSFRIDADAVDFDDAHAVIKTDLETFASVERFTCNLPRRLRRCLLRIEVHRTIGRTRHRERPKIAATVRLSSLDFFKPGNSDKHRVLHEARIVPS